MDTPKARNDLAVVAGNLFVLHEQLMGKITADQHEAFKDAEECCRRLRNFLAELHPRIDDFFRKDGSV